PVGRARFDRVRLTDTRFVRLRVAVVIDGVDADFGVVRVLGRILVVAVVLLQRLGELPPVGGAARRDVDAEGATGERAGGARHGRRARRLARVHPRVAVARYPKVQVAVAVIAPVLRIDRYVVRRRTVVGGTVAVIVDAVAVLGARRDGVRARPPR